MTSDQLEIHLKSIDRSKKWDDRVTLHITAYLEGTESINKNTLLFDCTPRGENYERTTLKAEFDSRQRILEIHRFLTDHLQKSDEVQRSRQIPVVKAKRSTISANGHRREVDDFDYLMIEANSEQISFGPLATMTPNIRFYETATEEGPQDRRNGERLLNFLNELMDDTTRQNNVTLQDDELTERCLPFFEDQRYPEAARLAGQILEERVSEFAPEAKSDLEGAKLMREVFSPDGGSLQISSDGGEQAGLMSMFAGSYQAIRNPLSHRTPDPNRDRYLDDLDHIQTKNILHNIDYLLTTLERNLD